LQAAADAASRQLLQFKPAELAMLCHALARLHYQQQSTPSSSSSSGVAVLPEQQQQQSPEQPQQQQQPLLWQVQSVSQGCLASLRFAEAANMLWAMGVLGQQLQPPWAAAALQQLAGTMQQADGKALANAVYGLAKLQHRPSVDWWESVWQHLPLLLPFGPSSNAAAAAAAGSTSDSGGSSASVSSEGVAVAGEDVQAGASFAGAAVAAGVAADSQAQATLMLSLAKLGVQLPPQIASLLLDATQLQLQLHAMNGAEVSAVAMAAAKMRLQPQQQWLVALEAAFESLLLPAQQQQQGVAVHQVTGEEGTSNPTADAVACQQQQQQQQQHMYNVEQQQSASLQPHAEQLHSPQQLQRQVRRYMQPNEVCNTLFSFARLRHVPSSRLLQAVQQYKQQHQQQLTQADDQQLARALQSFADQEGHLQRKAAAAAAAALAMSQSAAVAAAGMSEGPAAAAVGAAAAAARSVDDDDAAGGRRQAPEHSSSSSSSSSNGRGVEDSADTFNAAAAARVLSGTPCSRSSSNGLHHNGSSSNSSRQVDDSCWQEVGKYVLQVHSNDAVTMLDGSSSSSSSSDAAQSSAQGRHSALATVVQRAFLAAGELSIATS
jgi:hypothetical protein